MRKILLTLSGAMTFKQAIVFPIECIASYFEFIIRAACTRWRPSW